MQRPQAFAVLDHDRVRVWRLQVGVWGQAGGLGGSPRRAGLPSSAAYGLAAGPSSHETGRPDVLLHRAAVVTAIISTLLSDGPASRVVRKPVARTPR